MPPRFLEERWTRCYLDAPQDDVVYDAQGEGCFNESKAKKCPNQVKTGAFRIRIKIRMRVRTPF